MFHDVIQYFDKNPHGLLVEKAHNSANDGMHAPHIHTCYEIYYLQNGVSNYTIGDELYHLDSKSLVLIPPGVPHKSNTLTNLNRINIYFSKTYFSAKEFATLSRCFEKHYYAVPPELTAQIDLIFKSLLKETVHTRTDSDLLIRNYVTILLIQLNRLLTCEEKTFESTDTIIKNSLVYISEHLHEALSLEQVANHFALNPSYFSRKFKSVIGTNFKNYIIFARVGKAQQMLTNSNLSLSDISSACGFQDSNYFSTVFKRIIGVSPAKFRKQNKN